MTIFKWVRNESPDKMMEAYIRKQPARYWEQLLVSYGVVKDLITVGQSNDPQTLSSLLDDIRAKSAREKYMIGVVLNRFIETVTEVGAKQQQEAVEKLALNFAYLTLLEDLKTQAESYTQPCSYVVNHQHAG